MKVKCWECKRELDYDLEAAISDKAYRIEVSTTKYDYYTKKYKKKPEAPWRRIYCEACRNESKLRKERERLEYERSRIKVLTENAIRILETQAFPIDIYTYKDAIDTVSQFALDDPKKFDSAYEMVASIVLIHNRIPIKLQYKIGSYTVDILITSMNTVLEVDGEQHEHKAYYDSQRDKFIREQLGANWEVIRIQLHHLKDHAINLPNAIKALHQDRQQTRRKNNGYLPKGYSQGSTAISTKANKITNYKVGQ